MESSARLFAKVSETDKEEILNGVEKDRQFIFAAGYESMAEKYLIEGKTRTASAVERKPCRMKRK